MTRTEFSFPHGAGRITRAPNLQIVANLRIRTQIVPDLLPVGKRGAPIFFLGQSATRESCIDHGTWTGPSGGQRHCFLRPRGQGWAARRCDHGRAPGGER